LKINPNEIKLGKQSQFLEQGKIVSIHTDYPFSNDGFMLLLGKMGLRENKRCTQTSADDRYSR
jgi:hypothetical protein